uniref:Uncharacterized protein n=1 Tax=Caenorhabditis japonica TaxID=281687 RepID=A0A8R1EMS4_CAEJA
WGYKRNIGMSLGPHRRSMIARQIPQVIKD